MKHTMDEKAFLQTYDAYADALFRHCFFRTRNREHARDLVQETFMRTWEYQAKGKAIENIRAFLYRVANNLIIDHARKKQALSLDLLHEKGFDPKELQPSEQRTHSRIELAHVLEVVEHALDKKYRDVLVMRYLDGLKPKEIAAILGESENVVSVRLHRAVKHVQQLFALSIVHQ